MPAAGELSVDARLQRGQPGLHQAGRLTTQPQPRRLRQPITAPQRQRLTQRGGGVPGRAGGQLRATPCGKKLEVIHVDLDRVGHHHITPAAA